MNNGLKNRLQRDSILPLYYQIRKLLKERINNMEDGEKLPTEKKLAQKYDVSRGTIQKAIGKLVREGRLERKRGSGTFVSKPKISQDGTNLLSFTEEIKNHGYRTKAKILQFEKINGGENVKSQLQLGENEIIYKVKRIRYIEDEPMAVIISFLPEKMVGKLTPEEVKDSVYEYLYKIGCAPVRARDKFKASIANSEIAEKLNIPEGSAIFESERIAFTGDDYPVEYVRCYIQGRDYELTIESSAKSNETTMIKK